MQNLSSRLFSDVKVFFSNEINRLTTIVLVLGIINCIYLYNLSQDIKDLNEQINKSTESVITEVKINRNKIQHRYFNITKSLEKIHEVEIDTKTGEIKK